MTRSFFEIGGEIVELDNDYRFMTGQRTAKEHKSRKSMIKPVTKLADHMVRTGSESSEAANENKFGFEEAGTLVGIWFGLVVAAATLPVTVIDGPLPFMDAAWVVGSARFTYKASQVGGRIGEQIDELLD